MPNHQDPDGDGGESQEVVPGQSGVVRIPEACRQEHGEERCTKDAGPALLETEDNKLGEPRPGPAGWSLIQKPVRPLIDQALHGRETPHGFGLWSLSLETRNRGAGIRTAATTSPRWS